MPKKTMWGGSRVYIPAAAVLDSQFTFKEKEEILVEIDPDNRILKLRPLKGK